MPAEPKLTSAQQAAVRAALDVAASAGHMALMGPAGCGKTTTIRAIAAQSRCVDPEREVLLLAPTHKARLQLLAGALPRGTMALTIHKFCQVKASQWKDQRRFRPSSSRDLRTVEDIKRRFSLVVVDESSMVSHDLAAKAAELCSLAGVGIVFSGDPFQLPPVNPRMPGGEDDEDGADFVESGEGQAPEFVDAPRTERLVDVIRYGGPILEYATMIRSEWGRLHGFPTVAAGDANSGIRLNGDNGRAFVDHFRAIRQGAGGDLSALYSESPRAICHRNATVNRLTHALRREIYGAEADDRWIVGEIIMLPEYTPTSDGGFIHSCTDAIIVESEIIEAEHSTHSVEWSTVKRGHQRRLDLEFGGRFQRLTVRTVRPGGDTVGGDLHTFNTPLLADLSPVARYKEMRKRLSSIKPPLDPKNHPAWAWMDAIKQSYLAKVTSAFVMTVHKSQGSTFKHVYVSRDLLLTSERESRNPLLYVAATRAASSISFGRP